MFATIAFRLATSPPVNPPVINLKITNNAKFGMKPVPNYSAVIHTKRTYNITTLPYLPPSLFNGIANAAVDM